MKRDNPAKHFIFTFAIALVIYVVAFHFIENRRTRKGPWQVTFKRNPAGPPEIVIDQPTLGISNVQVVFEGGTITNPSHSSITNHQSPITNYQLPIRSAFSRPEPVPYDVPFGRCVFMDTTFLPGTLTFQFFGHEIELIPRVLILDRHEHPWRSGEVITLTSTNVPEHSARK